MVEVSRAVGRKRALEMLLTGDLIDAHDGGRVGSRQPRRAARAAGGGDAWSWPTRITTASSHALAVGKIAFYEQIHRGLPDAYDHTTEVMATNAVAPDAREGIDAFLSKREPQWRGREA